MLVIRGYESELSTGLTLQAKHNLDEATARLCRETGDPG